jgi:hypothetical protein
MPTIWFWIGPSTSVGLTQSVAPNARAAVNLLGLTSIAMIRRAPLSFAAWMTESPTAPQPKTATLEPISTWQVFHTAPHPVLTPQPRRHIFSRGARGETLAHEIAARTVYSEKVEQPMKW